MKNVYLFEINDVIANQIKLPYSTGLLWSYCETKEAIKENYKLDDWFYHREDDDIIFDKIRSPSIVGFSCFVWNWNFNLLMAKRIKKAHPECKIIFGGWQQPISDRSQGFFEKHPYVDILVHGEGEATFAEILLENIKEDPDFKSVSGCSIKNHDLSTFVTPPRARIKDIDSMPSPYLDGSFDRLAAKCEYDMEATIETTRGCPYSCTYCEIGAAYLNSIKKQSVEKVKKEIDWISDHKIEFVYNADSNFGLVYNDHLEVTKYMISKKQENGYPVAHRCDWAKNKAGKILTIAKLFKDASMDKGFTIALQSKNPETLKAIRRRNIDEGKLGEFLKMYNDAGVPAYVELILGLPEETMGSFIKGISDVMELEQHNYIGIYSLTGFPNTPFGEPEYVEKYGLKLIKTYTAFNHYDISEFNNFERETMIVGSRTMTFEEYKKCHYFRWAVMFGHYLGTVQFISRFLRKHSGIHYREFYEKLLDFAYKNPDSIVGKELIETTNSLEATLDTKHPWGRILNDVRKNFAWDFEEATAITIAKNKEKFYTEIKSFITSFLNVDLEEEVLEELIQYQTSAIIDPSVSYPFVKNFNYNIHEVIHGEEKLERVDKPMSFAADNYDSDYYTWGKEKLWWGRRVAGCKSKVEYATE
tara:strand:- start:4446 stop:6377 length:1932 start_codon:yes stop_codon:yes gene_type:complete